MLIPCLCQLIRKSKHTKSNETKTKKFKKLRDHNNEETELEQESDSDSENRDGYNKKIELTSNGQHLVT
ncbi:MAG: hypothetical protein VYC40_00100 [Pseudomonadota bacterium]|nr:hypothetical protein [Pseudomonadota bacterium]